MRQFLNAVGLGLHNKYLLGSLELREGFCKNQKVSLGLA